MSSNKEGFLFIFQVPMSLESPKDLVVFYAEHFWHSKSWHSEIYLQKVTISRLSTEGMMVNLNPGEISFFNRLKWIVRTGKLTQLVVSCNINTNSLLAIFVSAMSSQDFAFNTSPDTLWVIKVCRQWLESFHCFGLLWQFFCGEVSFTQNAHGKAIRNSLGNLFIILCLFSATLARFSSK